MDILTLDDFDLKGKTVLLRVDLNVPIDHDTKEILGEYRIDEAAITIKALNSAKIVVISHQGIVGRKDFVGMIYMLLKSDKRISDKRVLASIEKLSKTA